MPLSRVVYSNHIKSCPTVCQLATLVIAENRILRIVKAIGLTSADDVAAGITAMNQRLGLPNGLKAIGV